VQPVPVFRPTARIIVADGEGRVLLFAGLAARGAVRRSWITPGGGVQAGESLQQAAARELAEETGHVVPPESLGPVVATSAGLWQGTRTLFFGADSYFLLRVPALEIDGSGREEYEHRALAVHRWWTAGELETTRDRVTPAGLPGLLALLLAGGAAAGRPVRLPWRG
jgi:8-oxo-dGTP pyrophosphatase MutT (NUDIX family)